MPPPINRPGAIAEIKKAIGNPEAFSWSESVLIANVNAGYIILPPVPYYRYRMVAMNLVAVGAAVAGATDVRILATQGGLSVALMTAAIAGLTRSARVFDGSAGGVILADGASYGYCDVNTGITVGKTGATATGATAVLTSLAYTLERA